MKNIEKELENIKPVGLSGDDKHILWSKIEGGIRARKNYNKNMNKIFGMSARFVAVAVLVVLVLTSGSAFTVSAANAAAPGDTLFPVDEFVEKVELFFTRQENKAERRLEFAEERLAEAEAIIALSDDDDSSTSTDNTSTSTDGDSNGRIGGVIRAEHVLDVALNRLEAIREDLVEEGDTEGVAEIDALIAELIDLAEDHIAYLTELHENIAETREELKELRVEARISGDELRFRFDHRPFSVEGEDDEDEDATTTPGRRIGRLFDASEHEWKEVLCHITPGDSDNVQTIEVGSPAALRAHLAHGDDEGPCDEDSDDDEDEDEDEDEDDAKLTVIKVVVNDDAGTSGVGDFKLSVGTKEVDSGEEKDFNPGTYKVSEDGPDGYTATFSGACDSDGDVTLVASDDKTCTITNDDDEPST